MKTFFCKFKIQKNKILLKITKKNFKLLNQNNKNSKKWVKSLILLINKFKIQKIQLENIGG